MRRGDIYVAAARGAYTGKPRPVVVVQDDRFSPTYSVTVCPLTTREVTAPIMRLGIEPSERNGISQPSQIMVDKLTTMPRASVADHLGQLDAHDLVRLDRAILVFLGLAG